MDEENKFDVPDTDFNLDDILAEYGSAPKPAMTPPEELAGRSKRLVMKTMDDAFDGGDMEILGGFIDRTAEEEAPAPPPPAPPAAPAAAEPESEPEVEFRELTDTGASEEYAAPIPEEKRKFGAFTLSDEAPDEEERAAPRRRADPEQKPAKDRVLAPFMGLLALAAMRREQRAGGERGPAAEGPDAHLPEMEPEQAVKFYGARMASLRMRGRIAAAVSLVMLYVTFAWYSPALPLAGALGGSVRVASLLLLILEITVAVLGLDIFTGGLLNIPRGKMGAESLVAASCLLSMLDAAGTAAANTGAYGLPFCAASAISLTFAIWGAYYTCKGNRTSFRILTASKTLYTLTGERGLAPEDVALLKSRAGAAGFIRRSEEADAGEYAYGALAPFLLIASVVLGLLCSIAPGRGGAWLHCISVLAAVSATFSCAICFSVPFAAAARQLYNSGAALAGWSGLRDVGGSRYLVVTDSDLFPKGTVELSKIRILEGAATEKVISYTGSVIAASGNGLAAPFADLIRRNGYTISKVENFEPHDGGGMTAMVNGESVYVGGTAFMNLMGIRLPRKLSNDNAVYTAISGALVGIFTIEYKPTAVVQEALVTSMNARLEPIFAIRDFNITPAMLREKFNLPADSFKFPAYAERFRISGAEPGPDSRIAAVLARDGMGPLVEVAERGRRAHFAVRAATIISAAGSIFGMLLMLILCWVGAFDSASASNVILFMLLWLIPTAVVVIGLER